MHLVLKSASTKLQLLPVCSDRVQDMQVGGSKAEPGEEGAYEAALRICRDILILPDIYAAGQGRTGRLQ